MVGGFGLKNRHRAARVVAVAVVFCALLPVAHAVMPDEQLADAALETRARAISAELRCLVCQNQSIDDSEAPLARDLRLLVRERIKAGDDDAGVEAFIVDRYGEFVLLKPRLTLHTLLLWLAPPLLLLGGVVLAWRSFGRGEEDIPAQGHASSSALTDDERAKLDAVLKRDQTG